jgi:hypothetical protein
MKKLIPFLATLVAILVTYTSSAAVISAPPYDARIWAVHGPVKGSAAYAAWASNTVQYIYDHGTPPSKYTTSLELGIPAPPAPPEVADQFAAFSHRLSVPTQ